MSQPVIMNSRYYRGLSEFKKRCSDNDAIRRSLEYCFDKNVLKIQESVGLAEDLCVCDVGSGDGVVTSSLISTIRKTNDCWIDLTLVDVDSSHLGKSRRYLKKTDINLKLVESTAEDYFRLKSIYSKFNLILSSHSFHLIDLGTLDYLALSLRSSGYFVVVISSEASIMSELKDCLSDSSTINGGDVKRYFDKSLVSNVFDYWMMRFESQLDLKDLNLNDKKCLLNEQEKNLLSLLIQRNIDDISDEQYQHIQQKIINSKKGSSLFLLNDMFVCRKSVVFDGFNE